MIVRSIWKARNELRSAANISVKGKELQKWDEWVCVYESVA